MLQELERRKKILFVVGDKSESAKLLWVKIVSESTMSRINTSSEPYEIIADTLLEPEFYEFQPQDQIYLLAKGWGKCEIIATTDGDNTIKARPMKICVNIPELSMFS